MRTKPNAQPNQSLIDGIATLQALAISAEPVGCRELARRLGFEPTRVNRLLKTLAYLGIARQTADRKYAPGAGMHVLAAQSIFASGLIGSTLPQLEALRSFGHTVALGVLWRDNVTYLFHAPPGVPAAQAVGRIGLYPATLGGIGTALLASLDEEHVREVYDGRDIPGYPNGLSQLLVVLEATRERGYADVPVHEGGDHRTVAIALGTPVHSAVGMSGWMPGSGVDAIVAALRASAAQIEGTTAPSRRGSAIAALDHQVATV